MWCAILFRAQFSESLLLVLVLLVLLPRDHLQAVEPSVLLLAVVGEENV